MGMVILPCQEQTTLRRNRNHLLVSLTLAQCPVLTLRGLSPLSFQSWFSAPWGGWPRTTELRRAGNSLFCFTGVLNIYLYIYHISISVSLSSIYLSIYSSINAPSHPHTSLPTYLPVFPCFTDKKTAA